MNMTASVDSFDIFTLFSGTVHESTDPLGFPGPFRELVFGVG